MFSQVPKFRRALKTLFSFILASGTITVVFLRNGFIVMIVTGDLSEILFGLGNTDFMDLTFCL